jgi:transcriptional antiterminator RfaH
MTSHAQNKSLNWYAIYTKPRQEERAASNLTVRGIETFSPQFRESHRNSLTRRPMHAIKPLFPSYIFARFDGRTMLHKVWFTRGVRRVVSFGGHPVVVSDEIVSLIRSQIGAEGFVKTNQQVAVGDKVRIIGGPLSDFVGVFEDKTSASKRVRLLLSAVNYQCRVDIERDLIEKLS